MQLSSVTIARRFRGPITSANGGYTVGLVKRESGLRSIEVELRAPPPLETALHLTFRDGGLCVYHGEKLIADARAAPVEVDPPVPCGWDDAAAAAARAPTGWADPVFRECFVCGERPEGDGLGIRVGPVPGRRGLHAGPWVAAEASTEIVCAAIDCPGAYAVAGPGRGDPVLARMTVQIERLPADGERCVICAWPIAEDGRKLHAGTCLSGKGGELLAIARQLWIAPRPDGQIA